ncbi:MAG: LysR family transcriptional regulator [Sphingomonadales bacterium]|nr:LysR family transcriptional regulator [Sphingomonadales bacterium]MDE2568264.1 LysR family transcriptional regulator [Sphingomonadales bacterium]
MANLPFTLRQLDVFSTLCRSLSFRRCAEELNISQAAVSNQIKTLEMQLGVPLLRRLPGVPTRLTIEGAAFLADVRHCEQALGQLAAHRATVPRGAEQTRFRILVAVALMERYIKPKLDAFIADHPAVELEFVPQHPSTLPNREVEDGHFDFALYHLTAEAEVPRGMAVLARVTSGLLGRTSLAGGRALPLSAEEASDLPMILPPEGSQERKRLLAGMARHGVVPGNVVGHTQYYDVMARMIERGVGAGVLPMTILNSEARADIAMLFPVMDWLLVWYRRPGMQGATIDDLEEFIKSAINSHAGQGDLAVPASHGHGG